MRERAEAVLSLIEGPHVLDIGCGGGPPAARPDIQDDWWLHGQIRRQWPDVWGVEYDPVKVEAMAAAGFRNVHVGRADDLALARTFDTIVAGEVIEHLGRPEDLFAAADRHLKKCGRLIVTTPYPFGVPNVLYAWLKHPKTCSNPEHTAWFCPTTIQQLGERRGFVLRDLEMVLDLPPSTSSAYMAMRRGYLITSRALPRRLRANALVAVFGRAP